MCLYIFLQLFVRRIVPYILLRIMRHRNVHYYYYYYYIKNCKSKIIHGIQMFTAECTTDLNSYTRTPQHIRVQQVSNLVFMPSQPEQLYIRIQIWRQSHEW